MDSFFDLRFSRSIFSHHLSATGNVGYMSLVPLCPRHSLRAPLLAVANGRGFIAPHSGIIAPLIGPIAPHLGTIAPHSGLIATLLPHVSPVGPLRN